MPRSSTTTATTNSSSASSSTCSRRPCTPEILSGEKWAEVDDPNDLRVAEFMFNEEARPSILNDGFGGYWNYDILDFAFIRNMYFPTPSVLSEMRNSLPDLLYNYGSRQSILDTKMAWFLLCDPHTSTLSAAPRRSIRRCRERLAGRERSSRSRPSGSTPASSRTPCAYGDSVGIAPGRSRRRPRVAQWSSSSIPTTRPVPPWIPPGSRSSRVAIADHAGHRRRVVHRVLLGRLDHAAVRPGRTWTTWW